jgi:benzoate/toluate 1,2-dioxygenase reductase subunit
MSEIRGFDLMDPAVHADPHPTYRWLRENAPVYAVPGTDMVVVSRHEDVRDILRDPATFASNLGMDVPIMSMVMMDAPDHRRLRETINRAFVPRNVQLLAPRIEAIASGLAARLDGHCEFVHAFANPLPVTVICEMLGVPLEHRDAMNSHARDALLASFAATGMGSAELRAEAEVGLRALEAILDEAIELHRKTPKDNIISSLVQDEREGRLGREELRNLCAVLLIAGHETTANLLANGAWQLAREPELLARLRSDPASIPRFVEELARSRPPLQRIMRRTLKPTVVAGTAIPVNTLVMLLPGSANRDERRWPDGESFDIDRDAHGHLAFGAGVHACPGSSLTRLEARIAFEVLVRHARALAFDPERRPVPIIGYGAGSLGWNKLPLVVERAAAAVPA